MEKVSNPPLESIRAVRSRRAPHTVTVLSRVQTCSGLCIFGKRRASSPPLGPETREPVQADLTLRPQLFQKVSSNPLVKLARTNFVFDGILYFVV